MLDAEDDFHDLMDPASHQVNTGMYTVNTGMYIVNTGMYTVNTGMYTVNTGMYTVNTGMYRVHCVPRVPSVHWIHIYNTVHIDNLVTLPL